MTAINRKLIFDAAKRRGAVFKSLADVRDMDAAIDAAFVSHPSSAKSVVVSETLFHDTQTKRLSNPAAFFDALRASKALGPVLSAEEVGGCQAITDACKGWPVSWTAYALATAYHETAGTMQPIREYGRGKGRKYGVPGPHKGQVAYGRGYVQLTWPDNYSKADKELGLNGRLINDYDLALDHAIAAQIMVRGMAEGWFTGKSLSAYLPADGPATLAQFQPPRRIINGTDKAALIAGHAIEFQRALVAGEWK